MTKLEAIQAWLYDRHKARNWIAEEVKVYANELDEPFDNGPVVSVIGLKPAMIAMPHCVWVSDRAIYQLSWPSEILKYHIKIDMGSPKFFRVLLRAMKGNIRRNQEVNHG